MPVSVPEVVRVLKPDGYFVSQQAGPNNRANIRQAFDTGSGTRYADDERARIDAFTRPGCRIVATAAYDVRYWVRDIASLIFWFGAIAGANEVPADFSIDRHWRVFQRIIAEYGTPKGVLTNEHRTLLVEQKPQPDRRWAMPEGWEWDESLYSGSAAYYVRGRAPYAPELADRIAAALSLDGTGRLLDVGCGPGIVALPLASHFAEVVGIDPDAAMLDEASARASSMGITNARWVQARAEALPLGLGTFRAAAFAQSFHWTDRPLVAATVFAMLEAGGALLHINIVENASTDVVQLPWPEPPYAAIQALVRQYLGSERRAGAGVLRHGTPGGEAAIFREAGFSPTNHLVMTGTEPLVRDGDGIVAWVFSRSDSAPHLFGDRLEDFETELRQVLQRAAPAGRFADPPADTEVFVWNKDQC